MRIAPPLQPRDPRITVNQEFASAEDFVDQYVSNLSASGVFVRCDEELEIGMQVNLKFTVLDDEIEIIEGIGEIVRLQEEPRGIGVEFREMTCETMAVIERLVAKGMA